MICYDNSRFEESRIKHINCLRPCHGWTRTIKINHRRKLTHILRDV